MLLKFAVTVIIQAVTFFLSLASLILLPILLVVVIIVGLFFLLFGSAEVDSTNPSYVAVKLNDTYDVFEDKIFQWETKQ